MERKKIGSPYKNREIIVKKGLDIPLNGIPLGKAASLFSPKQLALNLDSFERLRFKILVRIGDKIKKGEPLVENKGIPSQMFVSPASGTISEIKRGLKRRLRSIVIDRDDKEENFSQKPLDVNTISQSDILERWMQAGIFPHICMRPFSLIANPKILPRDIFIKAVETAPYVPPAEMQVEGYEHFFEAGLLALKKITSGKVHLVYKEGTACSAFLNANANLYSIKGPHPAGNASLHIHTIAPIRNVEDRVWVLDVLGVIAAGRALVEGVYHTNRVISIAGDGVLPEKRGYFYGWEGMPLIELINNRVKEYLVRFISGDPLTGQEVEKTDFLGLRHTAFSVIPENIHRESFHFLGIGLNKYSATRAYLSGHLKSPPRYSFTTNQHGEKRAFIDAAVYEDVMPMRIPTMELVKAMLADDFELAERLGLLEVDPEDFALPSFICPSKIEMMDIIKNGIQRYAMEMGL